MTSRQRRRRQFKANRFSEGRSRCDYCGCWLTPTMATVDHFIPLSKGGADRNNNYRLACRECNEMKDDTPGANIFYPVAACEGKDSP